jgi:uncharacterized membrane protein
MKFNLSIVIIFLAVHCIPFTFDKESTFILEQTISATNKKAAFEILENHCNECHKDKKKKYVFTEENMSSFATKIHQQVYVKKKMPKGELFPLSVKEEATLLNWLETEISIGN